MSGCLAGQQVAVIPAKPPAFVKKKRHADGKMVSTDIVVRGGVTHICRVMANLPGVTDHHLGSRLTIRGMSQVELADVVGVGPNSVSRWVRGERGIKRKYLPKIAAALRITPEQLLQCDPMRNHTYVADGNLPIAQPAQIEPSSLAKHDQPTETHNAQTQPSLSDVGGEVAEILRICEMRIARMDENQRTILDNQERFIASYQRHDDGHAELASELRKLRLQVADLSIAIREILNRAA